MSLPSLTKKSQVIGSDQKNLGNLFISSSQRRVKLQNIKHFYLN